jgi:hypothetical protein
MATETTTAAPEDMPLGPVEADDPNPAAEARAAEAAQLPVEAEAADEPQAQESKREAIARGIRERRSQEPATDDTPEDLNTDVIPELQNAVAETQVEPQAPSVPKRKIKVDGQEIEISDDDLVRIAQQNFAADRRLDEAKRIKEEATRERAEANRLLELSRRDTPADPPAIAQPAAETAHPVTDKAKIQELRERILFGEEVDSAEALDELMRMSAPAQTRAEPDIRSVVDTALAEKQRKESTDRALAKFAESNADLVNDRKARLLVEDGLVEEMQRDMLAFPDVREEDVRILSPMQVAVAHRALREGGFQVRQLDALMDAAANSARAFRGQSPTPQPETRQLSSREELKRALPAQPRSAGIRVELGASTQQPKSRSDVINGMRDRTKGLPASSRH